MQFQGLLNMCVGHDDCGVHGGHEGVVGAFEDLAPGLGHLWRHAWPYSAGDTGEGNWAGKMYEKH